jgi:galactokinase
LSPSGVPPVSTTRSLDSGQARYRTGVAVADLEEAGGLLDPTTFRRVRYIVTENERVLQAVDVLPTQGPAQIGARLDASRASMWDDFEISCPELDLAVDTARRHGPQTRGNLAAIAG